MPMRATSTVAVVSALDPPVFHAINKGLTRGSGLGPLRVDFCTRTAYPRGICSESRGCIRPDDGARCAACTPSLLKKLQMPFWSSFKDGVKFWRQKCSRYSAAGFHFAAGDMSVDFTAVCKYPPFAPADSCFLIPYCAQDRAWNACRRRIQEGDRKGNSWSCYANDVFDSNPYRRPKRRKTQKRISCIR
jgi:hypothetical protein